MKLESLKNSKFEEQLLTKQQTMLINGGTTTTGKTVYTGKSRREQFEGEWITTYEAYVYQSDESDPKGPEGNYYIPTGTAYAIVWL